LELKIFGCHSIFFSLQKIFCKTLDGASNATKIIQIDKSLNMICILQMKGVVGKMWVATYDQFTFWSIRCLDVTHCFQRFHKTLDGAFNATKIVQIDEGLNKICIFQMKRVVGMWVYMTTLHSGA
jgi:hypothetical protein